MVRLVALNWVELTQGPLALTNIPPITLGLPGLGDLDVCAPSCRTTIWCSVAVVAYLRDLSAWCIRVSAAPCAALMENEIAGGFRRHRRDHAT